MLLGWAALFVFQIAEVYAEKEKSQDPVSLEQYVSQASSTSPKIVTTQYSQKPPAPPPPPYSSGYTERQLPEICTCNDAQQIGASFIWHCYCGNLDCVVVTNRKQDSEISCVYRK